MFEHKSNNICPAPKINKIKRKKNIKSLGKRIYSRRKIMINKNKSNEMENSAKCGGT